MKKTFLISLAVLLIWFPRVGHAESQSTDYKGISDPFGDPTNYEFSDDEREDKEFFHLGRFLLIGIDLGLGIFTGGLGATVTPGFSFGGKLLYFLDKSIAMEVAGHYSTHTDKIPDSGGDVNLQTSLIPINLGLRFYFDVKNAPKAISIANPYLAFGGGYYLRNQEAVATSSSTVSNKSRQFSSDNSFGAYGGAGLEFLIYRRNVYLGLDLRYHFVFFPDEDSVPSGFTQVPDRSGDYFTSLLSLSYNF